MFSFQHGFVSYMLRMQTFPEQPLRVVGHVGSRMNNTVWSEKQENPSCGPLWKAAPLLPSADVFSDLSIPFHEQIPKPSYRSSCILLLPGQPRALVLNPVALPHCLHVAQHMLFFPHSPMPCCCRPLHARF